MPYHRTFQGKQAQLLSSSAGAPFPYPISVRQNQRMHSLTLNNRHRCSRAPAPIRIIRSIRILGVRRRDIGCVLGARRILLGVHRILPILHPLGTESSPLAVRGGRPIGSTRRRPLYPRISAWDSRLGGRFVHEFERSRSLSRVSCETELGLELLGCCLVGCGLFCLLWTVRESWTLDGRVSMGIAVWGNVHSRGSIPRPPASVLLPPAAIQ